MAPRSSVRLDGQTGPEVESAVDDGTRTVVVGSIEQHGPHLPLCMETLDGDELARRNAERFGDALVAPTIRPGCSRHHMEFPEPSPYRPRPDGDHPVLLSVARRTRVRARRPRPDARGNFAPTNAVAPDVAREIEANVVALADLDEHVRLLDRGLSDAGVDYEETVGRVIVTTLPRGSFSSYATSLPDC
jgi:creatinine amidohydrolase